LVVRIAFTVETRIESVPPGAASAVQKSFVSFESIYTGHANFGW
jgi:hypothetical protein